jgi:hypothetical protein
MVLCDARRGTYRPVVTAMREELSRAPLVRPRPRQGGAAGGLGFAASVVVGLQRGAGNAAVAGLLARPVVQRCGPVPCDCPPEEKAAHAAATAVQRQAAGGGSVAPSHCPPAFCRPLPRLLAEAGRAQLGPVILGGIAAAVNPRVVPLWATLIAGGSGPQNLSSRFGADFTASPTTARVTDDLATALRAALLANPPVFPPGANTVTIPLATLIGPALAVVGDPNHPGHMNFDIPGDIAGNVAGGIGTNQTTHPLGATPSPFNDSRAADGTVTVTRNADGSLTAVPSIRFQVRDTIDLCPGDCGTSTEQIATVPLSRWEATGISGDVPIIVDFPAPARSIALPAPPSPPPAPTPAPPVTGTTTASVLRVRQAPNTSAPVVARYPRGTAITIECQTTGTEVEGNNLWDRTDLGFVSDRFVIRAATPPPC